MATLALATLAVTTLGIAANAAAAAPAPHIEKPLAGGHLTASPDVAGSSEELAGYQDTPSGGLASASVTFIVPTYTCTSAEDNDNAEEFNGVYTDSLETIALVGAQCGSGGPTYEYFFQSGSAEFIDGGAAAGDVIVATLFQSASSTWAKLHDLTNGDSWFADQPSNLGDTVVDIGAFVNSPTPVASFKKVAFTNATVNGDDLGFESPAQFNALNGGDLLIKTSGLVTTGTGSAFSIKFKHGS